MISKEAGVDVSLKVWEGLWHVFHFFAPTLPEANQAFEEINEFLDERV